jgi:TonB family protein
MAARVRIGGGVDRFFLLAVVLSAGMHTAVVARVRVPGERGFAFEPPEGLELRYVETVEVSGEAPPQPVRGDTPVAFLAYPDGAYGGDAPVARSGREANASEPRGRGTAAPAGVRFPPAAMQGTGEVLRASVQQTLRPLLVEDSPQNGAFSEAVRRYKTRLETILDRESRLAYPDPARENGREARLQIRFILRQDGSLESVELPPSCGGFERELVAGLKKAARHFPAFPEEIRCPRLTFCWPVSFNLN